MLDVKSVLGPGGSIAAKLPGYESRPQQLQMAEAVARSMETGEHLAIEAGTGTGKSLAYLVPAILSGRKVLVSTADKALQGQLWLKDVPFLQSTMGNFEAALMKGRSNYVCLEKIDGLDQGFFSPELQGWLKDGDGDVDAVSFQVEPREREAITTTADECLGEKCPFFQQCYVEKAKAKAAAAQVVIVNHALLLRDLAIKSATKGHVNVLPKTDLVVIDECHHLEEMAADAFGTEITANRWYRIERQLGNLGGKEWIDRADQVATVVDALFAALQARFNTGLKTGAIKGSALILGDERKLFEAAITSLEKFAREAGTGIPSELEGARRSRWERLAKQADNLAVDLIIAAQPPEPNAATPYLRYVEVDLKGRVTIQMKPVEVAKLHEEKLWNAVPTVVATSATVAVGRSLAYWKDRVGMPATPGTAGLPVVESPFDYAHNCLLYLPRDGKAFDPTASRQDGSIQYFDRLANEIQNLLLISDGRAFVLFTSNKALNEVYDRLSPRLKEFLVLKQGELPRTELVRRFKEDGRAILFGVKSFWEGVDVQGEALSMVIIDKLPFAPPDDPLWDAKCEAVSKRKGDKWAWFTELALPTATIALKQGFGRLIRSTSDRGVVAILDGRITEKAYGAKIVKALPPATRTYSLDAVRSFFAADAN